MYRDEIITIRFDEEMLKSYTGFDRNNPDDYFAEHKRAKKPPMESLWGKTRLGAIPSINKFLNVPAMKGASSKSNTKPQTNMARMLQNQWESHLKGYCEHCMTLQKVKHNYIDQCVIIVIQYKATASKSDNNNIYTKPFVDAMVERELLQEDNYTVVQYHGEFSVVDRRDPHSEIRIYPITDEYDFSCAMYTMVNDIVELQSEYADSFKVKQKTSKK